MTVFKTKPEDFSPKMEVSACIIEHESEILMLHRQDHKPQGNTWALPAGKLEKGETHLDAVKREVMEETNFETNPNYLKTVFVRLPEIDFIHHIFHEKVIEKFEPNLNLEEHKNFQWITPKEALNLNLIDDEAPCLKMFIENEK